MRRYVVTGAPGAGKTSVLAALAARDYRVVPEAATAIIAEQQSLGVDEPWTRADFIGRIARRQERLLADAHDEVQLLDRSLVCTLALQRFLGLPESSALRAALDRMRDDGAYQRDVFFVRLLSSIEPSNARRISYPDAVEFERVHEQTYAELGFALVDIPRASVAVRADLIDQSIRRASGPTTGQVGTTSASVDP